MKTSATLETFTEVNSAHYLTYKQLKQVVRYFTEKVMKESSFKFYTKHIKFDIFRNIHLNKNDMNKYHICIYNKLIEVNRNKNFPTIFGKLVKNTSENMCFITATAMKVAYSSFVFIEKPIIANISKISHVITCERKNNKINIKKIKKIGSIEADYHPLESYIDLDFMEEGEYTIDEIVKIKKKGTFSSLMNQLDSLIKK